MFITSLLKDLRQALACKCPSCGQGELYKGRFSLYLNDRCHSCGLDLAGNDSADGPAVFLIFVLGFSLVPLALLFEVTFEPPLWVHAVLWLPVILGLTLAALRPLKAYVMLLQYRHRPESWK